MQTRGIIGSAALIVVLGGAAAGVLGAQAPTQAPAPTTPGTAAAPAPQGRGRGPQGPPLVPTPPVTARPTDADGNFVIAPPYDPAPELVVKEGVPQGTVREFTMESSDSKIYPGITRNQPGVVPYTRRVAVYVPAQHVAGTAAPFIVVQDGLSAQYRNNLPPILDNLIGYPGK